MNGEISELLQKYGTSLEETRKLMPKLTEAVERERAIKPTTPQFFTPEEVKGMGLITEAGEPFELDPGWTLKVTPPVDGAEPSISYITPEKWEITQDQMYISPEGQRFTREEIEAQLAAPEVPLEVEQVFGAVFPEWDIEDFLAQMAISEDMSDSERIKAEQAQQEFIDTLQEMGRTEDTEALLRQLGVKESDIPLFFPTEVPLEQEIQEFREEGWLKDNIVDPLYLGAVNFLHGIKVTVTSLLPALFAGDILRRATIVTPEGETVTIGTGGLPHTEEMWEWREKVADDVVRDSQVRFLTYIEEHDKWIAKNPQLTPKPKYELNPFDNPELFKDPGYYAHTISSSIAYSLSVMGTIVVVTVATGGNPIAGIAAGMGVAGAPESADMTKELMDMGIPFEEAIQWGFLYGGVAGGVESVTSLPFIGIIFKPVKQATKPFWDTLLKVTANRILRASIVGGVLPTIEGIEEVVTLGAHNAIIKHYDETKSILEGMDEAFIRGVIASLPFAVLGGGASYRSFGDSLPSATKTELDGLIDGFKDAGATEGQAQVMAVNEIAKTPEGEKIITDAIEAIKKKIPTIPEAVPEVPTAELGMPEVGVQPSMIEEVKTLPELRALAKEKGYTITTLTEPVKGAPEAKYRIIGEKDKVYADDLAQVQSYLKTGRLVPPTPAEISITEEVTKKLTGIQKVRRAYQEKIKTYDETKKALVDYVKEFLPLNIRGKTLDSIKNVKTEAGLAKAVGRVNNLAEQNAQKVLRAEITNELKRTQAVVRQKILRGKFTAETQRMLDTIRHNLTLSRVDAQARVEANFEKYNKGEISWEEMNEVNEALNFVGIKEMTSEELMETLDYIKVLKEIGKSERTAKREVYKEKMDVVRHDVIDTASGGRGPATGIYAMPKSEWQANKNWVNKLINWQYNWDSLLDKISKFSKTLPMQSPISIFGGGVHRARNMQHHIQQQAQANVIKGLHDIYKTKNPHHLNQIANSWEHDVINLGEFELAAVEGVEGKVVKAIRMTKGQLMVMYNLMKDPTLDTTFRITMRWTDQIMGAVRNNLTIEEKAYADFIMDFMKNDRYIGYDAINEVYSDIYGVDLNNNPYYFPAFRDIESQIYEDILTFQEARGYASVLNGSLKVRVRTTRGLQFNNITTLIANHINRQAHFIAWGHAMRDMRAVFGNKEVRQTIEQYHGEHIMNEITKNLNDMARDGVEKQQFGSIANFLRGNFTKAILGVKPSLLLKQIPSVVGYSTEIPIGDFVGGVAHFWTNPVGHYKFMLQRSAYLKERFGVGFERDVHYANLQKPADFLSGKKPIKAYITENIKFGDKFAVCQGMWAVMNSRLKGIGVNLKTATEAQITEAMQFAEDVTNRTQPAFDIETLAPLQRGGAWVKLFTMFQTQPAQYFRMIGNNFRNFQYHRGGRVKALSNIVLVWVVLPCLWQMIADGFQWKKKHQLRAIVLGPLNWILIISQISQSLYDWAVSEPFDYQASPVMASVRDLQKAVGKIAKMVRDGIDPYKDISMEDVASAIEFFAKAVGQVTGYPTPYLVQTTRGIRHYLEEIKEEGKEAEAGELIKRFLFSEWSLEPPKQSIKDKAQEVSDKLGELIKETDEVRVEYGLPDEYYGMKVAGSEFRRIFEHTLLTEITKENGFCDLAVAWAEMEIARQSHADLLPNIPLYKINTDGTEGLTIIKLHQLWEARSRLTRLPDIVEFDKTWSDVHIEYGNVTRQQYSLLVKYLEAEDKDAFLEDHPELKVNPRNEWLKANPIDNARLAIWGQAKILSQEAYDEFKRLIKALDIPDDAISEFTLPPEGSVENYFKYLSFGEDLGYNSWEVQLLVAQDDELRTFLDRQPIDTPIRVLELKIKHRGLFDQYDALGDRESPQYIEDDDARAEAREKLKADNTDWVDDMRRIDAYSIKLPENFIEDYVEWYKTPRKGYEDDWFLMEHRDFYDEMVKLEQLEERDFSKVPDVKYKPLWADWVEQDAQYEGYSDRKSDFYIENEDARDAQRKLFLDQNSDYRKVLRKREAVVMGFPDERLDDYVGWYEVPPKAESTDRFYEKYPKETYYEDDWWLQAHPKFEQVMVDLYKDTDGAHGWKELRDYSKVPTKEVWAKYKIWKEKSLGKERRDYESANPDLDMWLHVKFGTKLESGMLQEPPLDDEEEFVPSEDAVSTLVDKYGFTARQAGIALAYTAYVNYEYQGRPVATEKEMLELIGRMVNEFTPAEVMVELESARTYFIIFREKLLSDIRSFGEDVFVRAMGNFNLDPVNPDPANIDRYTYNELHKVLKRLRLSQQLVLADTRLVEVRQEVIDDWAVPTKEAEQWVKYPIEIKVIPDRRGYYTKGKVVEFWPIRYDVGEITLHVNRILPSTLAHELAHANYFENIPLSMRNIYPYAHFLAQVISPEYREAIKYGEGLEVFPGVKVDKGKLPVEGYAMAYQKLAKSPEGIPWYLEPFYGNLMYEVPEDVKGQLGWLAYWVRWKLEEAFGNLPKIK